MKSTFTLLGILGLWAVLISTQKNPSNPPLGRTGAPGESTCQASGCHGGGNFTGTVSITGIPDTVQADSSYQITLIHSSNAVRAGFQLTCLDGGNMRSGTLTAGTGTNVSTNNATGRQYVRQSAAKTLSNGATSWSFTWKAPSTANANSIRFFFSSLAANNGTGAAGDNVLIGKDTVVFQSMVSNVTTPRTPAPAAVYPTIVTDLLQVDLLESESGLLRIFNAKGRLLLETNLSMQRNSVPVGALPSGYWIVQVIVEGKTYSTRVIK